MGDNVLKRGIIAAFALILVLVLGLAGVATAETLTFSVSDTAGDVIQGYLDITKIGAYADNGYQYFYVEFREAGINTPSSDKMNFLRIDIEADVNGEDVTEYVVILLEWDPDNHAYYYTVSGSSMSNIPDSDVTISGSKITVKIPATPLENVKVYNVEFTVYDNLMNGEQVTYYTDSSGGDNNSGGSNGGDENNEGSNTEEITPFAILAGVGSVVCGIVWFIIWLLIALWAYKDAKKKCMDNPIIWFLIVWFLNIIGLIIYIVIRKDQCQPQQMAQVPPPPS